MGKREKKYIKSGNNQPQQGKVIYRGKKKQPTTMNNTKQNTTQQNKTNMYMYADTCTCTYALNMFVPTLY